MSEMRVVREGSGALALVDIPPFVGPVLRELPGHLAADQPDAAKRRLFPLPTDDPEAEEEWRRTQHPELFALLADARQIVERDLASLTRKGRRGAWRLDIPAAHVRGWISALNAARLALGAVHDVTAEDMDPGRVLVPGERGAAIARIDLYGWIQGLLIESLEAGG